MTLDDILAEIKNAENIVVMAHEQPDGDAIGSSLAMCLVLKNMGKNVCYVLDEDDYPETFNYLQGKELITSNPAVEKFDLAICMDCPNIKRVSSHFRKYFEEAEVTVEFDHHTKNEMFADFNIVNHVSPATCQILVSSFEYLGIEITKDIGTCILTGIITDTNGFRNANTTVESLEFAEWALENGLNYSKIYTDAMLSISRNKFEAEKLAMNRMEFYEDGKVAYTYMTKEDEENLGLKAGDRDGIVEIGKRVRGVEVSVFLYEKESGYKASLRSSDYVNVAEVCSIFGGGGHIKAAGASLSMPLEEAKKAILSEVAKRLK